MKQAFPEVDHRIIFERVPAPCLVLLPDAPRFTVAAANDAYLALVQSERVELVGRSILEIGAKLPHPWADSQLEALQRSLEQSIRTLTVSRLASEGRGARAEPPGSSATTWRGSWAIVNVPILSDRGELLYLVHRVEPLVDGASTAAERQRMAELERMLEERTRELASTLAELEAFNYSVSHDLRAPLRAIDGFTQVLAQDYRAVLDDGARQYLDRVHAGAQRMSRLIDDLLVLSRIHRAPLQRSSLDVSELCRRIAQELAKRYPERQVEVTVTPGLSVHADPHLARVVFEQLLDNAWKFTGKRSPAHVLVGREAAAGQAALFVADDGIGFDMAYASRLFSPFQRLHKASEFEGTGIGLAMAHRILSRHGGRIWADAEVGKGAKFRLSFGDGDE
jgi:signal transduction histidine kinase